MQLTVIIALGVALALAPTVWRWRVRNRNGETPEARYRRDIQALKTPRHTRDVWLAGADPDSVPAHSRATKAAAWIAMGAVGGCGGCGGCGCGG
jgi:hypothetical protein